MLNKPDTSVALIVALVAFTFIGLGLGTMSLVIMVTWNAVSPSVSGMGTITFWQALALFILCQILLGAIRRK